MDMKTIRGLVESVHERAIAMGIDLSPSDTAFIIGLFLEGMADSGATHETRAVDAWLLRIAQEVNSVKDE